MDGAVDAQLRGKTITHAFKDGDNLILETTDGHSVFITWRTGEPEHVKTNVKVVVPMATLFGVAGGL